VRDDKDPQLMVNLVQPIGDADWLPPVKKQVPQMDKLYLRLPSEDTLAYRKTKAIINMFPGTMPVVLYFADTKCKRGAVCGVTSALLTELEELLGAENVVPK
jgi:hypothetical protein